MKVIANIILIVIALTVVAAIFAIDSLLYFAAWLVGVTAGIIISLVIIALHRRLITRSKPYWWVWHSLTFPVAYYRVRSYLRIAGDSQLYSTANLLFQTPKTWFTMRMLRVVGKEMNRRHEEIKRI